MAMSRLKSYLPTMKILAMPQTRATPEASSAAGPSPRMTTVLPATLKSSPSTVYTALPRGSCRVAISGGIDAVVDPADRFGYGEILGEGAVAVDAQDLHVVADVELAEQGGQVAGVVDVGLGGDIVADLDPLDVAADLHDFAGHLVAHGLGQALLADPVGGPGVPLVDVDVGAADGGGPDLDQHLVGGDPGKVHLQQFPSQLRAGFDHRFHLLSHVSSLACVVSMEPFIIQWRGPKCKPILKDLYNSSGTERTIWLRRLRSLRWKAGAGIRAIPGWKKPCPASCCGGSSGQRPGHGPAGAACPWTCLQEQLQDLAQAGAVDVAHVGQVQDDPGGGLLQGVGDGFLEDRQPFAEADASRGPDQIIAGGVSGHGSLLRADRLPPNGIGPKFIPGRVRRAAGSRPCPSLRISRPATASAPAPRERGRPFRPAPARG